MFSDQRISRLRVVKLRGKCAALPRCRVVTGLAALLELAVVRIVVARRAAVELEPNELDDPAGIGCVTLLARRLSVCPGESELGLRVIEIACGLPIGVVMTLGAVWSKLPLVLVLMATGATPA